MRRVLAVVALAALATIVACSSSHDSSSNAGNDVPTDLVPSSAAHATVTVTQGDRTASVTPDVVGHVVPFLVRRVFDATEPIESYGLDRPAALVTFVLPDGETIILSIGAQVFDKTAYYVQRSGDPRIWLVLTESITPLLSAS